MKNLFSYCTGYVLNQNKKLIVNCRYCLAIVLIAFSFTVKATNYYVSTSGNDLNPGTSENAPWQSLEKVNNFTPSPGDQILFKRGDAWTGTITVKASGTAGSPITYGAYGTGKKPKIYGSEKVTGWTKHSGNIYKATANYSDIDQVFINDTRLSSARYPNEGYFDITTVNSTNRFTSTQINSNINYSGATLVTRDREWSMATKTVTASSAQTLTINSAPMYQLNKEEGFVLFDKLEFLDQAGEWYYNNASNTIYLWLPNNESPENQSIRASAHDYSFKIDNKKHINILNLNLLHANTDAIYINNANNLSIDNNDISFPDNRGITITSSLSNNISITNNVIDGANHDGIRAEGTYNNFSDNTVKNIRLFQNIGVGGIGDAMGGRGISIKGAHCVIKNNNIENIAYNGIGFYNAPYTIIENNYIKNICIVTEDGGGIYCFNSSESDPGCEYSEIRGNIIDTSPGSGEGYPTSMRQGCGIYMDDRIHHITIKDNTIINCSYYGIFLHNNKYVTVQNNTFFDNYMSYRVTNAYNATGNIINDNIFVNSENVSQSAVHGILSSKTKTIASINSNKYIDKHRIKTFKDVADYSYKSFSEWQAIMRQDANSTYDASKFTNGETEEIFYNNTKQTKVIGLDSYVYRNLDEEQIIGSITLEPFTSEILIKTTTRVNNINQTPIIQGQNFDIYDNKQKNESIGQVLASDPDSKQILHYSITQGNEEDLFYINSETGVIYTNTAIDVSNDISVEMVVEVTDNASIPLSASNYITIYIHKNNYDTSAPVINVFSIPTTAESLVIPISEFDVSDNIEVVAYYLSEDPTTPSVESNEWLTTKPTSYTFTKEGNKTLYAWVKDAAGNISEVLQSSTIISLQTISATFSEYLFDEPEGITIIDSEETNNGIINNEASRTSGISENGLMLTKSGYVNLGQCFGDNVRDEVSLSAWIKPGSKKDNYQGIIMHGGPVDDTYALYINPNLKSISFKTSGTSSAWLSITNIDELWNGNWHFLTATYDGTQKNIYLDGNPIITADASGTIESGDGYNLLIGAGRDIASPTLLYDGLIDEVRIYNYALDDNEIIDLHELIDTIAPSITSFEIPSTSNSLSVPIVSFNAEDDKKVSAYFINEENETPSADDNGWQSSIPTEHRFLEHGENTLYAWVKDAAGNISSASKSAVTISLPDLSPTYSEYLFEETSGTTVIDSKGSNNGEIFNNGIRTTGINQNALVLNGSSYINVGQCFGNNVQNEVSLSAWIKPDANSNGYQGIIMHGGTNDDTYALYINPYSKSIGFKTTGTTSSWISLENIDALWDGNWHHLAATYNGSQKIIYLDNEPIITADASGDIESGDGYNLLIGAGRDNETPTLQYNGLIDEVRIYNYALSISDISELYHLVDIYITEEIYICENYSYQGWASAGQYQRVLQSSTGRDSIVTTNLRILPNYNVTEDITIIEGENYFGFTETGQYERILNTAAGCDSIVTTNLNVINHFTPIWENENGQNHMNIYIAQAQIEGEPVQPDDEIAIFDGNVCVGSTKLTSTIDPDDINSFAHVIVSQNDEDINGFIDGDTISFIIWDASEKIEKKISNINYKRDYADWITTGKFVANGTSVVELGIANEKIIQTQSIDLKKGWNIFSSYLIPTSTSMDSIQSELLSNDHLLKVQDELGNTYEEWSALDRWVNNIGEIQETEGYKIKVNSSCVLDITGYEINLPLNIDVKAGWNIISFPFNGSVDAIQVVQGLIDDGVLEKIMDEKGNSIENWGNLGWLNNIGNFTAGKGYKVKVNSDDVFPIYESNLKSESYNITNPETAYFKVDYEGNGNDHMNINIINLNDTDLQIGDEIAAFDNDICVGAVRLNDTNFQDGIISLKASVSDENMKNGFTEGDSILLRAWYSETNQTITQHEVVVEGEMLFHRNASVFIQLTNQKSTNIEDLFFKNIEMYPNPASTSVTIQFTELPESGTRIILTDMLGRQLLTQKATSTIEVLDIQSQQSGIYLVKIVGNKKHQTKRLIIK